LLSATTAFFFFLFTFVTNLVSQLVGDDPSRAAEVVNSRQLTDVIGGDSHSHSSDASRMDADTAMVMMVQQLGLIATTLVKGQKQLEQAIAQQQEVLAELVQQQKLQSNKLEELRLQQRGLSCAQTAERWCRGSGQAEGGD